MPGSLRRVRAVRPILSEPSRVLSAAQSSWCLSLACGVTSSVTTSMVSVSHARFFSGIPGLEAAVPDRLHDALFSSSGQIDLMAFLRTPGSGAFGARPTDRFPIIFRPGFAFRQIVCLVLGQLRRNGVPDRLVASRLHLCSGNRFHTGLPGASVPRECPSPRARPRRPPPPFAIRRATYGSSCSGSSVGGFSAQCVCASTQSPSPCFRAD